MGASQGKSKKEQKEEAREWARTKENEVAELYAQNTELRNQILMMQEDMRALRDMLKGQQSALNESVKQMNERMTEMDNDIKVVPFCGHRGENIKPLSSISSAGEQEIYYRNQIDDGGKSYTRPWNDDKKRNEYNTSYMWVGRVYSLKQFEKVYVDELKFKKITSKQYSEKHSRWCSYGGNPPYLHGYPKTASPTSLFPQITNVPHTSDDGTTSWFFKRNHFEPEEE